jgi:hypothetical protein
VETLWVVLWLYIGITLFCAMLREVLFVPKVPWYHSLGYGALWPIILAIAAYLVIRRISVHW